MKKEVKNQSKTTKTNLTTQKVANSKSKTNKSPNKQQTKNVQQTPKQAPKAERYAKIQIVPFVRELKKEFKTYKNVEKLKVVDEIKEGLPKMKKDSIYYLCQNQNGHPVVKTKFLLDYGYKKLPSGAYVPVDKIKVLALQTTKNIMFSDSEGGLVKLKAGDYVVISKDMIKGMNRMDFEENYKTLYKADKIIKGYENELAK